MLNETEDKKTPAALNFSEASASVVGGPPVSFSESKRTQLAGLLRIGSHGMAIMSGLGVGVEKSHFRSAAGGTGMLAASMLALYSAKDEQGKPIERGVAESLRPSSLIDSYASMNVLSGLCLVASGFRSNRTTEVFSGAWTASAFMVKRLMQEAPERGKDDKKGLNFSSGASIKAVGLMGRLEEYRQEVQNHPVKLSSDMLQLSAAFVMADAIAHRDVARGVSAILLAASNYAMRESNKSDYRQPPEPGTR